MCFCFCRFELARIESPSILNILRCNTPSLPALASCLECVESLAPNPIKSFTQMETVLNYMKMFADQCSKCTRCRKGLCAWLKKYRSEYLKNKAKKLLTSEQRVALCYPEAGEPCDSQLSFDEYVSGIDGILSHTTVPVSYQGLVETLSSLSQLDARSRRFSRQLHPLLPDFLGTGIEHCLAYIDYTYLKNRLDIEQLIIVFFPRVSKNGGPW